MFSQLVINSLISASIYALVATGLSLVYSVTRFFHFAHGAIFTIGSYSVYMFNQVLGLPLFPSSVFAVLIGGILGFLMELLVFCRLRKNQATPLVLLLASLGLYVVIQNLISLLYGDASKSIRSHFVKEGFDIVGAKITIPQIEIIVISITILISLLIVMWITRWGLKIRAVMSNPKLAAIAGLDTERIIFWISVVSSMLAAAAGVLQSLDINMTPTIGMNALMMGLVTAIIGGVGSLPGVLLGALLLSTTQQFACWLIGSQWQPAVAFASLLMFLILRPEGVSGKNFNITL